MSKFLDGLTPLIVVQAILSIIVVLAFVYQEVSIHSVDPDLKLITFGVIGFWIGGIAATTTARLTNGSKRDE